MSYLGANVELFAGHVVLDAGAIELARDVFV
jgi:hypothetical protein